MVHFQQNVREMDVLFMYYGLVYVQKCVCGSVSHMN